MEKFLGRYNLSGCSEMCSALLQIDQDKGIYSLLKCEDESSVLEQGDLKTITLSPRLGNIPLYLHLPSGARFLPDNGDYLKFTQFFDRLKPKSWVYRLESHYRFILIIVALVILIFYGLFSYGIPSMSKVIAKQIPVAIQEQVGEKNLYWIDRYLMEPTQLDEQRQQALQQLFEKVISPEMKAYSPKLKLYIRHSSIGANAFALADGSVILTDQLIEQSTNDDQIAAVLLHEIGHHHHQHLMQLMVRSAFFGVFSAWIFGDSDGFLEGILGSGTMLLSLQYSRDMERDADYYALQQMKKQKIPLSAMSALFELLDESHDDQKRWRFSLGNLFSTHPDMQERKQMVMKMIEEAQVD